MMRGNCRRPGKGKTRLRLLHGITPPPEAMPANNIVIRGAVPRTPQGFEARQGLVIYRLERQITLNGDEPFRQTSVELLSAIKVLGQVASQRSIKFGEGDTTLQQALGAMRKFRNNLLHLGMQKRDVDYLMAVEKDLS